MNKLLLLLFLSGYVIVSAQDKFIASELSEALTKDANSVVIDEQITVDIPDIKTLVYSKYKVITVLNKSGNRDVDAYAHYDDKTKVKNIKAVIYDKNGDEIEKYRKLDFTDMSAVDGVTLYSDSRILLMNYRPTEYPYTVEFEFETETKNTAFIPGWYPYDSYNSSTKSSSYSISVDPSLKLRHKAFNISDAITITKNAEGLRAQAKMISAMEREDHSPSKNSFIPYIVFSLDRFNLEGEEGTGESWQLFGKWMNDNLLAGTQELPEHTKSEVKQLVENETSNEAKARKIYEYMQSKTRYISVQVGIGGWKPMLAGDVDELGYGDCKALTNYTKALLDVAEIPSYYTVVYAGDEKRSVMQDFSSLQGDHVILAVPSDDDYIWLECTDQKIPFGFLGDFTDDRDVVVIKPQGGEIAHTEVYSDDDNLLKTTGNYSISDTGLIKVDVKLESKGIQYGDKYVLESLDSDDIDKFYKRYWSYINNIELTDIQINNDKENVVMNENIEFSAKSYASASNENLMLTVNALNRSSYIPKRYKDRKQQVEILRGFVDEDEIIINLPEGYSLSNIPEPLVVSSQFGSYKSELEAISPSQLKYVRKFSLKSGTYPKESYSDYRSFRRAVAKNDNQKVILVKI